MTVFVKTVCAAMLGGMLFVNLPVCAQERLILRYGSDMTLPWYMQKEGKEYGLVPAFGRMVEQQTNLDFVITPVSKKRALDQLVKGHVDVIASIADPQLQAIAQPINEVANLNIRLYLHRRFKDIDSSQLPRLNIADNDGRIRVESILNKRYAIHWHPFYNLKDAVVAVNRQRLDGMLVVEPVYHYFVATGLIAPDALYAEGEPIEEKVYFWVKRDRAEEKAIKTLSTFTKAFVEQGKMDSLLTGYGVQFDGGNQP